MRPVSGDEASYKKARSIRPLRNLKFLAKGEVNDVEPEAPIERPVVESVLVVPQAPGTRRRACSSMRFAAETRASVALDRPEDAFQDGGFAKLEGITRTVIEGVGQEDSRRHSPTASRGLEADFQFGLLDIEVSLRACDLTCYAALLTAG